MTGQARVGRIKLYFPYQGFGFIRTPDNDDYFFRDCDIECDRKRLRGKIVKFIPCKTNKGLRAQKIKEA